MQRIPMAILAASIASACSNGAPQDAAKPPTLQAASAQMDSKARPPNTARADPPPATDPAAASPVAVAGVYVARMEGGDAAAMTALFPGRFKLADGCLVFDIGPETYLPVFGPDARVEVSDDGLSIGATRITFDQAVSVGGGELARGMERNLTATRPGGCGYRLLRVENVRP